MNYLKRLAVSLTLTCVLAVSVFAGETNSPPACTPGETNSPPCTGQSLSDESTAVGETTTAPDSEVVDFLDIAQAAFWTLTMF